MPTIAAIGIGFILFMIDPRLWLAYAILLALGGLAVIVGILR
jgi:hypothetical protein